MSIRNVEKLSSAVNEAKRFIELAKKVQAHPEKFAQHWEASPKDTGALRRASMDLTRSLAELRKAT
jgi:3-methyladenine DNA glycosylase Tag